MNTIYILIVIASNISFLLARNDCLQEATENELGRFVRPDKETFYISPSGHFYIH